ncbi:lytic transglycosylase domain-containing protein [Ammoniphilus sp. CFH 90114]|uniref:lytic transglycosylase domain-containing protein n=1 Tax=Ammoniphilus sp. CFH 90114 TaxID=2493665 RepID=UPI001F0BA08E|nr:lytic transglycosylase domain-containing protein [Ammoniphilus sp. CFH 90114]
MMELNLNRKFTLLVLLLILFYLLNSPPFWKAMYPVYYEDLVNDATEQYQVDPNLVYAIIQIESNFKQERVSNKGATGLMQIMPDTAAWVIQQAQMPEEYIHRINDPKINIQIGSWYLAFLERKFHRNHYAVIASYNAGPGNVERWLRENTWDGTYQNLSEIPFGETRHYIQRVLYFYGKYQEVYQ